jgi:hypothetical protein
MLPKESTFTHFHENRQSQIGRTENPLTATERYFNSHLRQEILEVDYNLRLNITTVLHNLERANNMSRINCIAVGRGSNTDNFIKKPAAESQVLGLVHCGGILPQEKAHVKQTDRGTEQ